MLKNCSHNFLHFCWVRALSTPRAPMNRAFQRGGREDLVKTKNVTHAKQLKHLQWNYQSNAALCVHSWSSNQRTSMS